MMASTAYTSTNCPFCIRANADSIKEYKTFRQLSKHCRTAHSLTNEQVYRALYFNDVRPVCKCGCGEEVAFVCFSVGYRDYKVGHISRICNNYQTEQSIIKSRNTKKQMIANGTLKPFHIKSTGNHWALGLTKETDSRIANHTYTADERRRRSEAMKKSWRLGIIEPLSGPAHANWKGGISSLLALCHADRRLYKEWKYVKLCAAKFACQACDQSNSAYQQRQKLEVHHDKEQMSDIVRRIAISLGWSDHYACAPDNEESLKLIRKIVSSVADYHIENNVSAIVLCTTCHKSIHNKYNF